MNEYISPTPGSVQDLARTPDPRAVWRPGTGPLPAHYLEQAAWRLYQQESVTPPAGRAAAWPDVPSTVRNVYRRRVLDRLQAYTPHSANADLTLVLAWLLVGYREIPSAVYTQISEIAERALADASSLLTGTAPQTTQLAKADEVITEVMAHAHKVNGDPGKPARLVGGCPLE